MSEPRAQRVLVLFAHPAFHRSRVQRRLARAVRDLPGVTFHDLYDAYPDLDVDVPAEQALLLRHEVVVLQHPLFWYAAPPIVKQWMDLVLEHGWAFGRGGSALVGKRVSCALSTGGSQSSYARDGFNRFTLRDFLAPVEQSMRLCGVDFLPPFVVYGTHAMQDVEIERAADEYAQVIAALRDGRIDLEAARSRERLSAELVRTPVA